jgi:carboxymethylenebutenolidase
MLAEVTFGKGKKAYLGKPDSTEKRPAVVQLHERYGIVKHTTDLTQKLADGGYVGFAPDLFSRFTGNRKALAEGDAAAEIRDDEALIDIDEAIAYLRTLDFVDPDRIAVMGVCQTGRQPILAAAHRNDLMAILVLYGGIYQRDWVAHEERPETISDMIERMNCPVLGLFGEGDHIISCDDVLRFRNHLEQNKKSYHIRLYKEAPHGWLNDTMPGRYRPEAARDAWQLLLSFLGKVSDNGWDRDRVLWTFDSDMSPDYDFTKKKRLA